MIGLVASFANCASIGLENGGRSVRTAGKGFLVQGVAIVLVLLVWLWRWALLA